MATTSKSNAKTKTAAKTKAEVKTESTGENVPAKRGRGRPAGIHTPRPDMQMQPDSESVKKYLGHDMIIFNWPDVDMKDPEQVLARINQYFELCWNDDVKPSVAGMALAFGVDRRSLWYWVNDMNCKYIAPESLVLIKKAYHLLTVQMENYMQNGKINPVAGIFLMKNNMAYKDQQDVVITPNNPLGAETPAKEIEDKYAEVTDYEIVDN